MTIDCFLAEDPGFLVAMVEAGERQVGSRSVGLRFGGRRGDFAGSEAGIVLFRESGGRHATRKAKSRLEAGCADATESSAGGRAVVRVGVGVVGGGGGGCDGVDVDVVELKFRVEEVAAAALAVATRAPRTSSRQRAPDGHLRLLFPAQRVDCQGSALEKKRVERNKTKPPNSSGGESFTFE